jgi:hypothetical protein
MTQLQLKLRAVVDMGLCPTLIFFSVGGPTSVSVQAHVVVRSEGVTPVLRRR